MKRDVLFLGMDINKVLKALINVAKEHAITNNYLNLPEQHLVAYESGIEFALNNLKCLLDSIDRDNGENFIVHIDNLEKQEEFLKTDLFKLADKRGYEMLEVQ